MKCLMRLFVLSLYSTDANRINCEKIYFGEIGQLSYIECAVDGVKQDVYWFKGSDTSTYPILSFDDGQPEGVEYNKVEYELTDDKFLKIIDTQLKHEGIYTVRIYFDEFDFETTTTELRVYSKLS